MQLPTYKGYTVDYRLKQFRRVYKGNCVCGGGKIDFIEFDSDRGDKLLAQMIRKDLIPSRILATLF
jgi:hypothetical protein